MRKKSEVPRTYMDEIVEITYNTLHSLSLAVQRNAHRATQRNQRIC